MHFRVPLHCIEIIVPGIEVEAVSAVVAVVEEVSAAALLPLVAA